MMPIAKQFHVAEYPGTTAHVLAICAALLSHFDIISQQINSICRIMPKLKLDAIDRKILTALQEDARLSNVQLAEKIGL